MGPLILFGTGRVLYSLIERRDKWFVLLEFVSSAIFLFVGLILLRIHQNAVRSVSIGILFLITGLISRIIIPLHPSEAGGDGVKDSKKIVPIGIIDFVWICVMGATIAIIAFTWGVIPFVDIKQKGMSPEYYKKLFEITVFLLGKTIDSVFLLGGVLAACMSILWSGQIWRESEEKSRKQYVFTTISAIKMVVAYFIVILNALVWIGIPLYQKMNELAEVLK